MEKLTRLMETYFDFIETPIGNLKVTVSSVALVAVEFVEQMETPSVESPEVLKQTLTQLEEYFRGDRKEFSLELAPGGTDFQKQVWDALLEVPYARSSSYKKQSQRIGNPKAIRAVGTANGKNPISIIIPCHRIIGSDGSLTGYAGGLDRKKWLLDHEMKHAVGAQGQLF